MVTYDKIQEKNEVDGDAYTAYGIAGYRDGVKVTEVRDISSDEGYVRDLISLCNAWEVAEEHLLDVVEDYMADCE